MKGFKQKNPKNWIFPFPFCHTLPIDLDKCALEVSGTFQVPLSRLQYRAFRLATTEEPVVQRRKKKYILGCEKKKCIQTVIQAYFQF